MLLLLLLLLCLLGVQEMIMIMSMSVKMTGSCMYKESHSFSLVFYTIPTVFPSPLFLFVFSRQHDFSPNIKAWGFFHEDIYLPTYESQSIKA